MEDNAQLIVPPNVRSTFVKVVVRGHVEGMQNLTIGRGAEIEIFPSASTIVGQKNNFKLQRVI